MNKLITITGAKSGFGKETFLQLYKDDKNVFLLIDLKWDSKNFFDLDLKRIVYKDVNVVDRKTFKDAITEAEKYFNTYVEVMVNNAGIMPGASVISQTWEEIDNQIAININGLIYGSKLVLENMLKHKKGTIINISSIAGVKPFSSLATYCGTKYAVMGFSDTLRREVAASNIRVSVILPGAAATNLWAGITNKEASMGFENYNNSVGGAMDPKEVAGAICYAINAPQEVNIRQIQIAPTRQDD